MSQNISAYLVQLLLALALAPLLPGIINRVKAKTAGRRGKPLLQTYYDLARLLRKGEVISRTAPKRKTIRCCRATLLTLIWSPA